jgi:hypothetical protein
MKNVFHPASLRLASILGGVLALASFGVALSANTKMAPADAYFGRMKMSFLGINLTFKDQQAYANPHSTDPAIINKVRFADDALQDWQQKYPTDPQLARSYFLAQQTFQKLWVKEYQDRAWTYMQLILKRYPNTFFSKTVATNLNGGYTEHFYTEAVPCADPGLVPVTPKPIATPGARPGERGVRKYDIIDTPCFTPQPLPTNPATVPQPENPTLPVSPLPASPGVTAPVLIGTPAASAPAVSTPPVSAPSTIPLPSASPR